MVDLMIGGLIAVAVVLAIRKVIKNQKSGGCGCGCSGCGQQASCHGMETLTNEKAQEASEE